MEPQPSPDASKRKVRSFEFDSPLWWKQSGVWIVGIFMLVAFLFSQQPGGGYRKNPNQIQAVNNARQIGMALFEFQEEYGKFPDASTIAVVRQGTATDLNLGTKSANDFFRQLFVTGIVQDEAMFYAEIDGTRRPDNDFTKAEALKKGECGFAYLLGAAKVDNLGRPIVMAPLIPGTDRFDPKPFKGKAVILRLDNSVTSFPINKDGYVFLDGRNMMDPHHPIWEGHAPVIAWPDL